MYTHIYRHTPTHMHTLTHMCALTNILYTHTHTLCAPSLYCLLPWHHWTCSTPHHSCQAVFRLRSVQARSNLQREGGKLKQCYQYYQHKFMMCTRYNYPSVHAKLMQSIHVVILSTVHVQFEYLYRHDQQRNMCSDAHPLWLCHGY